MLLRILLSPFSFLYGNVVLLRNLLYKIGLFSRMDFDFPIICVGNLSAGGTGKTPHIEFLIRALRSEFRIAVLSRGYKRKTTGYLFASVLSTAEEIGDEPLQFKKKFKDVAVAVCENRLLGVPNLLADAQDTDVVLMDDGFQHLPIKAGMNIILTPYNSLFTRDWLLPAGRLREFRMGYKRANVIIVSKCPPVLSNAEREQIIKEIKPQAGQQVFFTSIRYDGQLTPVFEGREPLATTGLTKTPALGFAGIADAQLFREALTGMSDLQQFVPFSDHHQYTENELSDLVKGFGHIEGDNKIIITTEKDAMRLQSHPQQQLISQLPLYYLGMEIVFIDGQADAFIQLMKQYVITASQGSN